MWFKNIKLFLLPENFSYSMEAMERKLQQLAFQPCSAAMPMSVGFVPPLDREGAPLVHGAMGKMLICLNIEEKVLPASIVRQQWQARIKELERLEERQLSKREKASLKDQVYFSLIQKALCRPSRLYAYFDLQNKWMVVDSNNSKKLELLLSNLKKALEPVEFALPQTQNIANLLTQWLLSGQYPKEFEVEDHGKFEDFNNKNRVITCRNQDLFNANIQNIIKEGCVPKQVSLSWQERVTFSLNSDFTLSALKYADSLVQEAKESGGETEAEQFDADFFIMTETLKNLIEDLLRYLGAETSEAA